jgi:ubiquitin C-terminal hydrolase
MKGLQNNGNTCYFNAGLQMLIQNKELCNLINDYSKYSNKLNIINEFIKIYYDTNTPNVLNPNNIKLLVEQINDIFIGCEQHDSTELVLCILNIIDDEIIQINKKNLNNKGSNIESLFGIKINIRIKCKLLRCLNISTHIEMNNLLLLDINGGATSEQDNSHNNINTLDDAYRKFKSHETLALDDKYYCDKCENKTIASKRSTIIEWPNHLFIWLKRFNHIGKRVTKNSQPIQIPLKWKRNYFLEGAIIHYGSLNGGHYVYIGKQNDEWFLFDDSRISKISNDDIDAHDNIIESELTKILNNAYWLYYKKEV